MVGGSTNYRGGRADSTRLWGTLGHGDGRCRINTSGNNLAILTNNSLAEDSFGCDLLAGGGNHLFTVLGHHSVYNVIELLVANLPRDLHLPWNTGGLWYTVAFWLVNCKGCVASQELREEWDQPLPGPEAREFSWITSRSQSIRSIRLTEQSVEARVQLIY